VDRTVIRDPLSNRPYIPGSSLRGKMRSLTEKHHGAEQNNPIGRATIHTCKDHDFGTPTRLLVRDVPMAEESAERLRKAQTDLPSTEVKTEVAIDRVTSVASPRQMERVPADVVFGPAEMVYSVYSGDTCDPAADIDRLQVVVLGLKLLEDDYLGGLGSRGSGKVRLERIRVGLKEARTYPSVPEWLTEEPLEDLAALDASLPDILGRIRDRLGIPNPAAPTQG